MVMASLSHAFMQSEYSGLRERERESKLESDNKSKSYIEGVCKRKHNEKKLDNLFGQTYIIMVKGLVSRLIEIYHKS